MVKPDASRSGDILGSYHHQSVADATEVEVDIEHALENDLPTIDVQYTSSWGHEGVLRLLLLPEPGFVQKTDVGEIYSFMLASGEPDTNREVSILIPRGGGRAIITLPF